MKNKNVKNFEEFYKENLNHNDDMKFDLRKNTSLSEEFIEEFKKLADNLKSYDSDKDKEFDLRKNTNLSDEFIEEFKKLADNLKPKSLNITESNDYDPYEFYNMYVGSGMMAYPKGRISFREAQELAKNKVDRLRKKGYSVELDMQYGLVIR